jgi:hypothetical protein
MGIKLNFMKKVLSILFFVFLSCKTSQKVIVSNSDEESYVQDYKTSVFFGCVDKVTSGNFNKFSKENNDLGLATTVAILNHANNEIAINYGRNISKKIRTIEYADYEGKKPIFADCLAFAFSKETDSIARLKFK